MTKDSFLGANGLKLSAREMSLTAKMAAEALVTSASSFVLPVTRIDGVQIGDGKCGPITRRLREIYIEFARSAAI